MKKIIIVLAALAAMTPSFAQEKAKVKTPSTIKLYGFIRNFTAFDTRDSYAGTKDLFYFAPKDEKLENGNDVNANPSFRNLALTSRLGVDVNGFQFGETKISGKIEADFYCMNGSAAAMRLRQAFMNLSWEKAGVDLKIGQAWHPMAADMAYVIALETASPFGPFSRTPQIMANWKFAPGFTFTGGFITQMQYLSTGPNGKSDEYMKYGLTPELYAGFSYNCSNFLARAGVSVLSIKPRQRGKDGKKLGDRLTTISPFIYLQYAKGNFKINAKTTLAQAGEHMQFLTGYGVSEIKGNGEWEYTPMQTSASFVSVQYGRKWQVMGMLGYFKYLGTTKRLVGKYWSSASDINLNSMIRFTPTVQYNIGKFQVALEYAITAAQYGGKDKEGNAKLNNYGINDVDTHWVTNHRLLTMVKFSF